MNEDYKLSNYKDLWTKFCFLDESGSLSLGSPTDILFTIGIIKCSQPYYIQSNISYERSKCRFYDEIKFNKLSKNNLNFAQYMLNCLFNTRSLNFYSYTVCKHGNYFYKNFNNNIWQAYEDITIKLMEALLPDNEILILIADNITTPRNIKFEVNVKRRINENRKRLSVAGVCRFDSKSNDLLQLTDLLIGAINYDLKLNLGIVKTGDKYKKRFLAYFKKNLGIEQGSLINGFKNYMFNIFVDKDIQQEHFKQNEKGPSS